MAQVPQLPSHLKTVDEPEPMAPLPMAVPRASKAPSPAAMPTQARIEETPRLQSQRGLSREKLKEIADERTRCPELSLRAFAQRLYEKGIYHAKSLDGREVPANKGTISDYLKRAAEAGLL